MSERLLPLVRPIYETQGEIADAKRAISESPGLQSQLEHQNAFDDQIVTALQTLALTDQQIEQLENLLVDNPVETPAPPQVTAQPADFATSLPLATSAKHEAPAPAPPAPVLPQTPIADATAATVIPEVQESPPIEPKKEAEAGQPTAPPAAEEAAEKAEEEEKEEEPPRARPVTIMAAVSVGLIATIALIAWIVWDQMHNGFTGVDQVTELLNTADKLNGDEFEAVPTDTTTTTANLKDWFFLKSDMHWFAVPKEFADTPTLGCRVFKFSGADIGQILAKSNDREVLMFLFHPADLGVKMRKGKWVIVDGENWEGAVTAVEDCCFIVAFKGKHSDMQLYLDKKLKK
ncbi:MAG: hypothetical protein WAK31_20975 [Chthoniobacterales bacterium]